MESLLKPPVKHARKVKRPAGGIADLTSVRVASDGVTLTLSAPRVALAMLAMEPPTLTLEIPNLQSVLESEVLSGMGKHIKQIRISRLKDGGLRVEIALDKPAGYTVKSKIDSILVHFDF